MEGVLNDKDKSNKNRSYQRTAKSEARFMTKNNATSILACWSLTPFRWKKNRFKCAYCEEQFVECLDLRCHVRACSAQHNVKDIYSKFREMTLINVDVTDAVCQFCHVSYSDVDQMRHHVIEHGFDFNMSFPNGVLPFRLDNSWKCVQCDIHHNNFLKLYEHMNCHYQHYICSTCGKGYMNATRLRKHSELHITGKFPCKICKRVFSRRTARDCHIRSTHAKGPRYECPLCDLRFVGYYDRMRHLKDVHEQNEVSYKCSHCELSFRTSGKRSSHVNSVHFPHRQNFSCKYCDWIFKTGYELKRHLVKHTKELNYSCNMCDKCFSTNKALKNHLSIHDKLYCKWCGLAFKQQTQVLAHIRENHHDNKDLELLHTSKNLPTISIV